MSVSKIVVDTDLMLDHLTGRYGTKKQGRSTLRQLMAECFCYTTVFNAIEVFSLCESRDEIQSVEDVMQAMKILGLNGKSGKNVGRVFRDANRQKNGGLAPLIAGLCIESRLPLVTNKPHRYRGIRGLRLMSPSALLT